MTNYSSHILIISFLSFIACTTVKKSEPANLTSTAPQPFVLKYERGPCFGTCPVYAFYLMDDHTALVNAKSNLMDSSGWYAAMPDQEAVVEILEMIEPQTWWAPDFGDQPEIPDLPSSSLYYYHPSGLRSIRIQSRTTHELQQVFEKINHLVTECTWKPTNLRPLDQSLPDRTDVIVQLKSNADLESWLKRFDSFGIQLVKRLTPNQSYYLVRKDPAKGNSNDFLQYIKADPDVINAQWDNPISKRE